MGIVDTEEECSSRWRDVACADALQAETAHCWPFVVSRDATACSQKYQTRVAPCPGEADGPVGHSAPPGSGTTILHAALLQRDGARYSNAVI
jgi:hypothetical protein